jgi:hypothetical protein
MTPRALITAIGATAIAFAAIIASLSAATLEPAETSEAAARTVRVETYAAPGAPWNDDCAIAV